MDMPVSTSSLRTQNDETSLTGQSLIEVARHHGMRDDDPVMPLIVAWQASLEALRAQQSHLGKLYIKAEKEITYALQKRIEFSDKEAERLNALAATLQVRMVSDIGNTIARASEKALTKRVKLIESRTICTLAAMLLVGGIATYSIGHRRGYNAGAADKAREAELTLTEFRSTATGAGKLFFGKPKELELWAPIIRLNQLGDTHSLDNCYKNTFFNFGGFADQLGCWLPVRIPVRQDHPRDMPIPLPAPKGPPLSEDVWR
ncbi:hypothetical protein AD944_01815 [Acetobacter tropicalis]|uniref:Uncharacterized protein n=2 Tax=Acetobacter tropicalis TaxID=104102 RepID=A0A511FS39_9PROT|nr:hypothetical protein AD944_01815 [Acetobacter tropicalis]GEL51730.1 hypothetical protein ATR01nite_28050 [Acetobacter tropicalis]